MFVAGKIGWFLVAPGNLLAILLVLGIVLAALRRRGGLPLAGTAATLLVAAALLPVGVLVAAPLEDRFPAPPEPARIDGIVLLGGALDLGLSAARGRPVIGSAGERVLETALLAHHHPEARIVVSGGDGRLLGGTLSEAAVTRDLLVGIGVPAARIIVDEDSRTTAENAVLALRAAQPRPEETWLLVTSAMHMPRAMGVFRAAGWRIVPHPVDYRTAGMPGLTLGAGFPGGLGLLNTAAKEWAGLLAYRLAGRSDALLPGP